MLQGRTTFEVEPAPVTPATYQPVSATLLIISPTDGQGPKPDPFILEYDDASAFEVHGDVLKTRQQQG